jgi:hypothetical protein
MNKPLYVYSNIQREEIPRERERREVAIVPVSFTFFYAIQTLFLLCISLSKNHPFVVIISSDIGAF